MSVLCFPLSRTPLFMLPPLCRRLATTASAPAVASGWRNHLAGVASLRNRFVMVRHGESEANVLGLISCRPDASSGFKHGLSPAGREQAARASATLASALAGGDGNGGGGGPQAVPDELYIYTSDLRRTRETAEALRAGIGLSEAHVINGVS